MDDLCRLIRDGLPGVTLLYESHRVLAFQAPAPAWQAQGLLWCHHSCWAWTRPVSQPW